MSTQIELDHDIFDYLKAQAEPFVDTPNTVLRRLLGLGEAPRGQQDAVVADKAPLKSTPLKSKQRTPTKPATGVRARAAAGTLLPEERYEQPLLRALDDAGGQAPYREIVEAIGRTLKGDLMPADFETLTSGSVRWQSRIQFVRLRLIERGYLDRGTPRGIWGITDAGREAIERDRI